MDLNAQVDQLVKASQAWIPMIMQYGSRVLLAIVTLCIGWWLINNLTHRVGKLLALRNADLALQGFISSLANVILKVLLIVSVASMIGVETTSFVAAIGAAGLAIGLALQGSLANFAGGVLILLFRPFRIGDTITAQGVTGTVDSIQIFHTILRTGDNQTVIVPNGNLSNGIITNINRQATRKVVFDVGVDFQVICRRPARCCWRWPRIPGCWPIRRRRWWCPRWGLIRSRCPCGCGSIPLITAMSPSCSMSRCGIA